MACATSIVLVWPLIASVAVLGLATYLYFKGSDD